MKLRNKGAIGACCLVIGLSTGAPADATRAGGGPDIASAPTVVSGQQQFGNTTTGCRGLCEYWNISLIAADRVTIDWETSPGAICEFAAGILRLYPSGTTDFSINNTGTLDDFDIGGNHTAESKFVANRTGTFPFRFDASCVNAGGGGPYDFVALVRHLPVISFARPASLKSGTRLVVAVHYADGKPISDSGLQIQITGRWNGAWHPLGSAAPTNGSAVVTLRIPHSELGKTIGVRATASGANYVSKHTSVRTVRIR